MLSLDDGRRYNGVVREKVIFTPIRHVNGDIYRPGSARYRVMVSQNPYRELSVNEKQISRDRKSFTKLVIRAFIKDNVTRESWTGAPWLVKELVAEQLKIDTAVPSYLQHKIARRKSEQAQKKGQTERTLLHYVLNPPQPDDGKLSSKSNKGKQSQPQQQQQLLPLLRAKDKQNSNVLTSQGNSQPFILQKRKRHGPAISTELIFAAAPTKAVPKPPPPPPVPKYPIEDLEVPLRKSTHRPALKYLSQDTPTGDATHPTPPYGIRMESVGALLETWNTLNVFCQVLFLDSFTFDDYMECLHVTSSTVDCELYVEVHCALLKLLVADELEGGEVLVRLPELRDDDSEEETGVEADNEEEDSKDESEKSYDHNSGKDHGASINGVRSNSPLEGSVTGVSLKASSRLHRASELTTKYDWIDHLRKRDFKRGGWESIIVGLLHRLSLKESQRARCDVVLSELLPLDCEPTVETVAERYASLDINLRIKVLEILCLLIVDLKSIRGDIETNNEISTEVRKEKVEWQRQRKTA